MRRVFTKRIGGRWAPMVGDCALFSSCWRVWTAMFCSSAVIRTSSGVLRSKHSPFDNKASVGIRRKLIQAIGSTQREGRKHGRWTDGHEVLQHQMTISRGLHPLPCSPLVRSSIRQSSLDVNQSEVGTTKHRPESSGGRQWFARQIECRAVGQELPAKRRIAKREQACRNQILNGAEWSSTAETIDFSTPTAGRKIAGRESRLPRCRHHQQTSRLNLVSAFSLTPGKHRQPPHTRFFFIEVFQHHLHGRLLRHGNLQVAVNQGRPSSTDRGSLEGQTALSVEFSDVILQQPRLLVDRSRRDRKHDALTRYRRATGLRGRRWWCLKER